MKNQDKLIEIDKSTVRRSIAKFGVWQGIVLYQDTKYFKEYPYLTRKNKLVYATLTNYANLNDPNLLEFYNLS